MAKHEIRHRDESILQTIQAFLLHRDFNAGTRLIVSWTRTAQKSKKFSIATLTERINPIVIEKLKFGVQNFQYF